MPSPASVISHGENDFQTRLEILSRRSGQPDSLEQTWCVTDPATYQIGAAPDGHANLRVIEIDPQDAYGGGGSSVLRLRAEGIDSGETSIELVHDEDEPSETWDTIRRRVYTRDPHASHLRPGGQLMATPITGVTGTASTEVLQKTAHGLTSGRLIDLTLGSGFAGLTDGGRYVVLRRDADSLHLLTTTGIYASGVASTNVFSVLDVNYTAVAHGLTNGEMVAFVSIEGGAGLVTFTVYYVISVTTTTFQLSATSGGAAIDFTTDIPHAFGNGRTQLRRVATFTTDGTGATLTPVSSGYERMFITDISRSKALGYLILEVGVG